MSIDDKNTIDAIGTGGDSDNVVLLISDHHEWDDVSDDEHMYKLQEKVNSYLRFYESGEIYIKQPDAMGKKITIEIVGKYDLNTNGKWFIEQINPIVNSAGVELKFRLFE